MNLLFICRHNKFRSKAAEALFKHHYKGDRIIAKSAGAVIDLIHPFVPRSVISVLREKGISLRDDGAKKVDEFILKWADIIVIVANNIPASIFRDKELMAKKRIIQWSVSDVSESDVSGIKQRVSQIESNVFDLIKILG